MENILSCRYSIPADVALSEAIRAGQDFQVPTTKAGKPDSRWAKVHQTLKDILEDFDLDLDRAALEEAMSKGFAAKAQRPSRIRGHHPKAFDQ